MEVVDTVTTMPRPCLGGDSPSAPRTGLVFPSAFSAEHQAHCLSGLGTLSGAGQGADLQGYLKLF